MSYQERIFREVKRNKNCFLNWQMVDDLRLGEYGFYNGRTATFDWQGHLSSAGLNMQDIIGTGTQEEKYRSAGKVNVEFDLAPETPASANVLFRCRHAFAYEGYEMRIERLNLEELKKGIFAAVGAGKLKWHRSYLVVTQITRAESFTTLISGSKKSTVKISAPRANNVAAFNLANPRVGLKCELDREMTVLDVARKSVVPFFIAHRVAFEDGEVRLKRFGDDYSWF